MSLDQIAFSPGALSHFARAIWSRRHFGPWRRRIEVVVQTGATECGLVALEMILQYYGHANARSAIRSSIAYGQEGVGVDTLMGLGRECGLDVEGFMLSPEELHLLPVPAILHWRRGHYVVLESSDKQCVNIVDPAVGRRTLSSSEFRKVFSGVALSFEPNEVQRPASESGCLASAVGLRAPCDKTLDLGSWLHGQQKLISLTAVGVAIEIAAVGTAATLTVRLPLNVGFYVHPGIDVGIALLVAFGAHVGAALMDRLAGESLCEYLADRFAMGMRSAPPSYLSSRKDQFFELLATELDPSLDGRLPSAAGLLRLLSIPPMIAAMAFYSWGTAASIASTIGAFMVASALNSRAEAKRNEPQLAVRRRALRTLRMATGDPEDLQAGGMLGGELDRWRMLRRRRQLLSRGYSVTHSIRRIGLSACLFTGGWFLWSCHRDSPGTGADVAGCLAFACVVSFALGFNDIGKMRALTGALARLRCLLREGEERSLHANAVAATNTPLRPQNHAVDLRGVVVRSGAHGRETVRRVDLSVGHLGAIAIVGGAGAGKTCMARLLLGLASPHSGMITIYGVNVATLTDESRVSLIGGVLDSSCLAEGTIDDNLMMRLGGQAPQMVGILRALEILKLREWIQSLPLGSSTPITRGGASLPQHKRRLLCAARILAVPPKVIVLDATLDALDATDALDIARSLRSLPSLIVLCTSRPEAVPQGYERYYLN